MARLSIKPLSVNKCWQGRRFKTKEYKKYQEDILTILPRMEVPEGELELYLEWGFSNAASDFDNPVKPFVDCLQKKYGFNDKRIKRCLIEVVKVKKGEDYIEFEFKKLGE